MPSPDPIPGPSRWGRPAHSAWHRLDPLTRLVVALGTLVAAVLLRDPTWLLLLAVVAVLVPAAFAGVLPRVLVLSVALSAPLLASAVIVNVLFPVDGVPIATLGPFEVTAEGIALAVTVAARVLAMAGAAVLFSLTTRPSQLVASLQHHGVPARLTFLIHHGVAMIPRLAERARDVADAQRARGLDTEGSFLRRARGVMALAAPTVLGTVRETETRTLALETRGFSRPGRATVLWPPRDSRLQRLARWAVVVAVVALALGRLAGLPTG